MRETAEAKRNDGGVEAFEYPAGAGAPPIPAWEVWDTQEETAFDQTGAAPRTAAPKATDKNHPEEEMRSFEAGRERGRQEGRQTERESQAAAQAAAEDRHKRQIAGLIAQFAEEQDRFLRAVEQEVVKLALAVAARILRREAQMDPLLLTGAVRVALGQLGGSCEVKLRVPAAEMDLWKETVALLPNLAIKPVVVAGEGMRVGECQIESKLGTVDLGIRSQLAEIERGFFDRAASAAPHGEGGNSRDASADPVLAANEGQR